MKYHKIKEEVKFWSLIGKAAPISGLLVLIVSNFFNLESLFALVVFLTVSVMLFVAAVWWWWVTNRILIIARSFEKIRISLKFVENEIVSSREDIRDFKNFEQEKE